MPENKINAHGMSDRELSSFCAQVAMMLSSGLALFDGMEALARTHKDGPHAHIYARVSEGVMRTGSLYEALKEDKSWPGYLTEMAGIGEKTGRLEEVMTALSAHYEREGRIRRAVINAVTYPMVLGAMMLVIIVVMLSLVMPMFRRILDGMGVGFAEAGSGMMQVGVSIGWCVLAIVGVILLAAIVCVALMKTGARSGVLKSLEKLFPAFRRISMRLSASRVANVLSLMIKSGYPMDEALEMAAGVLEAGPARDKMISLGGKIGSGCSLGQALDEADLFDEVYLCMIHMGLEVGCMDSVMDRIAKDYEEQVEEGISGLVSIIEPTLVAVLSVVIGAMLLSVMLPMAGVLTGIISI